MRIFVIAAVIALSACQSPQEPEYDYVDVPAEQERE